MKKILATLMTTLGLLSFFAIIGLVCPALAQTNYSKTADLPPLRISASDLQAVLTKAGSLLVAANSSANLRFTREALEVGSDNLKLKLSGHTLESPSAKIQKTIDSFEYDYSVTMLL